MAEFGDLANVAQLMGLDAVKLIGLIIRAANTARMHRKNCQQFANHVKLIGNLLGQLKISELKRYSETREPLELLEDALRRSYLLVNSCQDRSYLYLLAMGWNIVYQFKKAQNEIDRYLKLVPLITLVDNARVREKLQIIEMDQREYTFDEEDQKVQQVILKADTSNNDTVVLKKTLSCSYPKCSFDEALRKENEKLRLELQRSQANFDVGQCEVIERLLEVTQSAAAFSDTGKSSPVKSSKPIQPPFPDETYKIDEDSPKKIETFRTSSSFSSRRDLLSQGSYRHQEWNTDLLDCCSEPCLCLKTCFYPCGTLAKVSTVANNRFISSTAACSDLLASSLILSCFCYTCSVRGKLRKRLNIKGGVFDDFLSHLMCCCCALVQEWREVEIRDAYGREKTEITAPTPQFMES
ncbi:hypothetical protein RND81_13G215400 [Saponaria officinalis]|uniref:MCAfunc domain-containing protein n=1 Tax=Saponaria officinalis TaxID=3572 RepID=A0AAW1H0P2_SAPOF